jgi:chromatin remodeling complex protein RSC6
VKTPAAKKVGRAKRVAAKTMSRAAPVKAAPVRVAAKPVKKAAPVKAAKKAVKAAVAKKADKPAKKATGRGSALMKPLQPDAALAEIVGEKPLTRGEVTKGLWTYIRKHGLQDANNKKMINADEKLAQVFGGKKQVIMFEMLSLASRHLG